MMGKERLGIYTPLFIDMHIAVELLHISHEEFLQWPRLERKKARMYLNVKNMKMRRDEQEDQNHEKGSKKKVEDVRKRGR